MLPKKHFLFGTLFAIVLALIFPMLGVIPFLIIVASTFLIDVDHYLYYVYESKDVNPKRAIKWFMDKRAKFRKLSSNEKKKVYTCFRFLHGLEWVILFVFLGIFVSNYFIFVFVGISFHLILDYIEEAINDERMDKVSIIWDWFKYKKLKKL